MKNLSLSCIVLVLAFLSSYASIVDGLMFPHLRFLKLPCNSKNVTNSTMTTMGTPANTSSVSVQESIYGTTSTSATTMSAQEQRSSSSSSSSTIYAIVGSIAGVIALVFLFFVFRGQCNKTGTTTMTKSIPADNVKVVDTTPAVVKPAARQSDNHSVADTEGSGSV